MEIEGLEIVRLELKYCERCGGLWMRIWGTEDVYCPSLCRGNARSSHRPQREKAAFTGERPSRTQEPV